jgi:hypothetical protein
LRSKYTLARGSVCASILLLACGADEASSASAEAAPAQPAPRDQPPAPTDDGSTDVDPGGPEPAPAQPTPERETPDQADIDEAPVPAPEPAARCNGSLSFDDLYAAIERDLSAEDDDAPFLRYVSLGHRYNQGICPEDLDDDRLAMARAINALSTEVGIVIPEAIDEDEIVYRIDLRDLGWDQPATVDGVAFDDKWEAIIAASPYAIELEGDDADAAKLAAQTTVPVLSSDALIDATVVGDLYYELIGMGANAFDLFAQLGIDFTDVDVRAGMSRSRMSQQDTIIQRFEQGNVQGFYWSRFDIADANGGQSIFADPLGFQGDVISSLYTLPNGLLAFALFDAAGARIADTGVLVDQFQRDGRVRNSVSCSGCHASGVNTVVDEVRTFVEANRFDFDADTFGDVDETFLPQPELDEVILGDRATYQATLERAGLLGAAGDPVSAVYQRFDGGVSLAAAAGELGITPDDLGANLIALSNDGDPVLSVLATQSLRREQFDGAYLPTLCALLISSDNQPLAAECDAAIQ